MKKNLLLLFTCFISIQLMAQNNHSKCITLVPPMPPPELVTAPPAPPLPPPPPIVVLPDPAPATVSIKQDQLMVFPIPKPPKAPGLIKMSNK